MMFDEQKKLQLCPVEKRNFQRFLNKISESYLLRLFQKMQFFQTTDLKNRIYVWETFITVLLTISVEIKNLIMRKEYLFDSLDFSG